MSDNTNEEIIGDGGAAFPFDPRIDDKTWRPTNQGMSLRDYFAAAALNGMMSNDFVIEQMFRSKLGDSTKVAKEVVEQSFACADAMLKARAQ